MRLLEKCKWFLTKTAELLASKYVQILFLGLMFATNGSAIQILNMFVKLGMPIAYPLIAECAVAFSLGALSYGITQGILSVIKSAYHKLRERNCERLETKSIQALEVIQAVNIKECLGKWLNTSHRIEAAAANDAHLDTPATRSFFSLHGNLELSRNISTQKPEGAVVYLRSSSVFKLN